MADTVAGARFSIIVYDIAETAKANNQKPYDYFEYLQTGISKHLDGIGRGFLESRLSWSSNLPAECQKPDEDEVK